MRITIAFALASAALLDQSVILIGAPVKSKLDQDGRVLTDDSFLAETGTDVIEVTNPQGFENEIPLAELQEFLAQIGGSVVGAHVSSDSLGQSTANFFEKVYTPFAPVETSNTIVASQALGNGENAGKVLFNFAAPFQTAPNKALLMTLKAGKTVCVKLIIEMNVLPRLTAVTPLALAQQVVA